jgi:hypothetical protein
MFGPAGTTEMKLRSNGKKPLAARGKHYDC